MWGVVWMWFEMWVWRGYGGGVDVVLDDEDGHGNGISWECQYHEEAVSAQNYGPIFVACALSARKKHQSHPLAGQAQACGRLTKADGPEGPMAPVETTDAATVDQRSSFKHRTGWRHNHSNSKLSVALRMG